MTEKVAETEIEEPIIVNTENENENKVEDIIKVEDFSSDQSKLILPKSQSLRKRKWDDPGTEVEAEAVLSGDPLEESKEIPLNKEAALKVALEAAKKIKANLSSLTVNELTKEKVLDREQEKGQESSVLITSQSADAKTYKFTRNFDISKSPHASYLSTPSFHSRLLNKLQLGPDEQFSITLNEPERSALILSASGEDILDLAEKECKISHDSGEFNNPRATPSTRRSFTEIIPLNFDPLPNHVSLVRGKLLGPQGSFLKHIQTSTRTRVTLRGRGSGHIDPTEDPTNPSAVKKDLALHLVVEGMDEGAVLEAKQLCEDLVETAKADYETKLARTPSQTNPINYSNYPSSTTIPGYPQYSQQTQYPPHIQHPQYPPNTGYPPIQQIPQYHQYPQYSQFPQYQYPNAYPQIPSTISNTQQPPQQVQSPYYQHPAYAHYYAQMAAAYSANQNQAQPAEIIDYENDKSKNEKVED